METANIPKRTMDDRSKSEEIAMSQVAMRAQARVEFKYRLRIVTIIIPGLLGLLIFSLSQSPSLELIFPYLVKDRLLNSMMSMVGVICLATSALTTIMLYLQTGFIRGGRAKEQMFDYELQAERTRDETALRQKNSENKSLANIESRLARLEHVENTRMAEGQNLLDNQQLVTEISDRLKAEASEELLNCLQQQAQERLARTSRVQLVDNQYTLSARRLNDEIRALGWRGNLNLSLGVLTTVIGLGLLSYFAIRTGAQPEHPTDFVIHFVPRLSVVVFIEAFAYFFLNLYKATLLEIKYFQNEVTNIESVFTAARAALELSDINVIQKVIEKMASTERNHILKKGETTVQLEQQKCDKEYFTEITKRVTEAVTAAIKK